MINERRDKLNYLAMPIRWFVPTVSNDYFADIILAFKLYPVSTINSRQWHGGLSYRTRTNRRNV